MPSLRARGLTAPTLAAFAVVLALVAGMFALLVAAVRAMDGGVAAARQANGVLPASRQPERGVAGVEQRLAARGREGVDARMHRTLAIAGGGLVGSALLLGLLALALQRLVLVPVRRVARAARLLAAGHGDARVPPTGRGEVAVLARAFNGMAETLTAREDELLISN